jgi:1-acyl-sn-glycerol-3-phosphate acyltransferase
MEMQSHAWKLLASGPLSVTIRVSQPIPLGDYVDRKTLAISSERAVRDAVHRILRHRLEGEMLVPVEPPAEARRAGLVRAGAGEKWT